MNKITINTLFAKKGNEKIVMLTAYDALFARLFDDIVDMILVGDSLNMSFGGNDETISLSLEAMIYHACAVKKAVKHAYLVVDMPFGSCVSVDLALKNAIKVYQKTGCDAIKIEGGAEFAPIITALNNAGISVMSHIGLKPQYSRQMGGFKVQGINNAQALLDDAKILEDAGATMLLVEGTIAQVATKITQNSNLPVIGIGSGANTDGQVLVWSDMLGFFENFKPKFVKQFLNGADLVRQSVNEYAKQVRSGEFPSSQHEYKFKG